MPFHPVLQVVFVGIVCFLIYQYFKGSGGSEGKDGIGGVPETPPDDPNPPLDLIDPKEVIEEEYLSEDKTVKFKEKEDLQKDAHRS